MSEVVVDASAVLALLNQETGSEEVSRFIGKATDRLWGSINVGVEVRLLRQTLMKCNAQVSIKI